VAVALAVLLWPEPKAIPALAVITHTTGGRAIYVLETKLLPEPQTHANHGELLRTIGFSSTPGLLRLFGVIPGLTSPVFVVTHVWMLVAMIIAVRQALDYVSILRAVAVCVLGLAMVLCLLLVFVSPVVSGSWY
jgi:hypothetical protein